jgi:hypothetical protein
MSIKVRMNDGSTLVVNKPGCSFTRDPAYGSLTIMDADKVTIGLVSGPAWNACWMDDGEVKVQPSAKH